MIRDGQTLRWGACAFLLLATPAVALDRGTVISGPAHVIDGDTIDVAGFRVRLHGVAAPERSEPGGAEATAALRQVIAGQVVRCSVTGFRLGRNLPTMPSTMGGWAAQMGNVGLGIGIGDVEFHDLERVHGERIDRDFGVDG